MNSYNKEKKNLNNDSGMLKQKQNLIIYENVNRHFAINCVSEKIMFTTILFLITINSGNFVRITIQV